MTGGATGAGTGGATGEGGDVAGGGAGGAGACAACDGGAGDGRAGAVAFGLLGFDGGGTSGGTVPEVGSRAGAGADPGLDLSCTGWVFTSGAPAGAETRSPPKASSTGTPSSAMIIIARRIIRMHSSWHPVMKAL